MNRVTSNDIAFSLTAIGTLIAVLVVGEFHKAAEANTSITGLMGFVSLGFTLGAMYVVRRTIALVTGE